MKRSLSDALEACLRAMERGESLEAALKKYPDLAGELKPLLEAAQLARGPASSELPEGTLDRGSERVLAAAASLRRAKPARALRQRAWRRVLFTLISIVVIVLGGNGLVIASARSLPGDPLYAVKRSAEVAQLNLLFDPVQRQALQARFNLRRVEETESLIGLERVESVEFDGVVTSQTGDGWQVAGIPVVISADTQLDSHIKVGDTITVAGMTNVNGRVEATHLTLSSPEEGGGSDLNEETQTMTPTEAATQTMTGTALRPTASRTSRESESQATPLPGTTMTPHEDHGGDGGGDDHGTQQPTGTPHSGSTPSPQPTPSSDDGGGGDGGGD